jgi:hypothetical protein
MGVDRETTILRHVDTTRLAKNQPRKSNEDDSMAAFCHRVMSNVFAFASIS